MPVAPVAAASTSTASGQTAVTSTGVYTQDFYFYFLPLLMLKLSNMSLIKSNVSSVFYNDVMLCNWQLFLIRPPISMMSPLATIMILKLASTMIRTAM